MSLYRVYRDDEVSFIVSTEGVLKKSHKWIEDEDQKEEFVPVPQEELTKTWNEIVSRMASKARKKEQDMIFANIRSVLLNKK